MKLNNSWGRIFALATAGGFLLFDGCALKMGKQPRQEIVPLYSTHSAEFRQAAGSLLGPNFIPGNNIYHSGKRKSDFPGYARRNSIGQVFN